MSFQKLPDIFTQRGEFVMPPDAVVAKLSDGAKAALSKIADAWAILQQREREAQIAQDRVTEAGEAFQAAENNARQFGSYGHTRLVKEWIASNSRG